MYIPPKLQTQMYIPPKLWCRCYLPQLVICSYFVQKLHIVLDTISEHFVDGLLHYKVPSTMGD